MYKTLFGMFSVAALAAGATTPVTWTNVNAEAASSSPWGEPANWQDANGDLLAVAPTSLRVGP